jgi:hypothetical protein
MKAEHKLTVLVFLVLVCAPTSSSADIIRSGYDLSQTAYAYKLFDLDPIPANAFGPGSDPFTGRIDWTSGPLTQFMSFSLPQGFVDTIVFRSADAVLSGPGSTATIPVQMVALSFAGVRPIEVTFMGGARSELWIVDAIAPNNPVGTMTIRQTSAEGGTFDSEFHVHPIFTLTRLSDGFQTIIDVVAAGLPPNIVRQEDIPWRFDPITPPPTANYEVLRIPGLTTNFVPGYTETDGRVLMVGRAFRPDNPQGQARGEHGHFVSSGPEPSTVILSAIGTAALLGLNWLYQRQKHCKPAAA